jgi:hypothetical protein
MITIRGRFAALGALILGSALAYAEAPLGEPGDARVSFQCVIGVSSGAVPTIEVELGASGAPSGALVAWVDRKSGAELEREAAVRVVPAGSSGEVTRYELIGESGAVLGVLLKKGRVSGAAYEARDRVFQCAQWP